MRWDDLDLDDARMHIRQSLKMTVGKLLEIGPLKTPASRRALATPEPVVEASNGVARRTTAYRSQASPCRRPPLALLRTAPLGGFSAGSAGPGLTRDSAASRVELTRIELATSCMPCTFSTVHTVLFNRSQWCRVLLRPSSKSLVASGFLSVR